MRVLGICMSTICDAPLHMVAQVLLRLCAQVGHFPRKCCSLKIVHSGIENAGYSHTMVSDPRSVDAILDVLDAIKESVSPGEV